MTYTTRTPEQIKEPVTQRKTPGKFAKFVVLTSTLFALSSAPISAQAGTNPVFFRSSSNTQETVKTEPTQATAEEKERGTHAIELGLATGIVLFLVISLYKLYKSRHVGPWGTDLKEWNKHLDEMKRKREEPETKT